MAYLAIRGSGAVNGVSRLHGKVSRRLFLPLFPRWPEDEVPIGHVTNGVHMPTWDSAEADDLWTESLWKGPLAGDDGDPGTGHSPGLRRQALAISRPPPASLLWSTLANDCPGNWPPQARRPRRSKRAKHLFDPNTLTLGFARRFATYKRPNLLLHDPQRLLRLLTNPQRPVQLIIAGKAHPADQAGQALIREWMHFIRRPEARPHAIFLE